MRDRIRPKTSICCGHNQNVESGIFSGGYSSLFGPIYYREFLEKNHQNASVTGNLFSRKPRKCDVITFFGNWYLCWRLLSNQPSILIILWLIIKPQAVMICKETFLCDGCPGILEGIRISTFCNLTGSLWNGFQSIHFNGKCQKKMVENKKGWEVKRNRFRFDALLPIWWEGEGGNWNLFLVRQR